MKISAVSLTNKGIITIKGDSPYRLERKGANEENWLTWTASGFAMPDETNHPMPVPAGDLLDNHEFLDGIFSYRCVEFSKINPLPADHEYSNWVRYGTTGPIGWSFGNYQPPPGQWGEICTPDDLRETWIWGNDFKSTNGRLFTDAQIRYYIDNAIAETERRLNITIIKKRIRCNAKSRNLVKGQDYDIEEGYYDFRYEKIARYGTIVTNQRPIIKLHRLDVLNRFTTSISLLDSTVVDKTKGVLKMMRRPIRPSETSQGISTAIYPYGKETFNQHMFYAIDYDVGYETSDDIPMDLREAIGKNAAISLLNIIGDGLLSGFSSSSLSMDGMSESFSSTQSATSAYFGARIKVYEDELKEYIKAVSRKFGFMQAGVL
jgi:hypothetical protein